MENQEAEEKIPDEMSADGTSEPIPWTRERNRYGQEEWVEIKRDDQEA
jgi:hypothetical protein